MSKQDQVKTNPAFSHMSHGLGPHVTGHAASDIARDGAAKRVTAVPVHSGMRTKSQSGADALSGHHAAAIDSLSGATVPAARNTTALGWGNAGVQSGHPLAKPPGSKNVKAAPVAFGMKSRNDIHAVGAAILDAAFSVGSPDDKAAHGRGHDGKKIK